MKERAYIFLLCILFLPCAQCNSESRRNSHFTETMIPVTGEDTLNNRKPAVAGTFYARNGEALRQQLSKLFLAATPSKKLENITAVISPHAGYVYSGIVAASVYNQLSSTVHYDNVFIIGSSHYADFEGASIYSEGNFITPLGMVRVNIPLAKALSDDNPGIFKSYPEAHVAEHSLEVQIPFLQYIYKDDLQIVPILLGTQNESTCKKIAAALSPYLNEHNLFIISTDFSHYPGYPDACKVDGLTAESILKNSPAAFMRTIKNNETLGISNLATSVCGWTSILTLLTITEKDPAIRYHTVKYMNSGDAPNGDKERVVGYHALVVTRDIPVAEGKSDGNEILSGKDKAQLLQIARSTIQGYFGTRQQVIVNNQTFSDKLLVHSGAFVTLTKHGELRGCIGQFAADKPLYKTVQEMALAAATRDHRFEAVSKTELDQIRIEISVLTPMRRITSIKEIELGKHGIYIKKGNKTGTFLPQVATQTGWDLEEFLGHCSRDKAGIGWDGWKEAEIYVYSAYVFGEH